MLCGVTSSRTSSPKTRSAVVVVVVVVAVVVEDEDDEPAVAGTGADRHSGEAAGRDRGGGGAGRGDCGGDRGEPGGRDRCAACRLRGVDRRARAVLRVLAGGHTVTVSVMDDRP